MAEARRWTGWFVAVFVGFSLGLSLPAMAEANPARAITARSGQALSPNSCPPHLGFPLCPLPTLGFPVAERELARVYRTMHIPASAQFGMQTPVKTITDIPRHVLMIEYGVEHAPYPYTNPCTGIGRVATIRGDAHATVCIEPGRSVIVAALWHEMGATWQATLSSNHTKPYTSPQFVRIIDGWHTTGERPLAGHR